MFCAGASTKSNQEEGELAPILQEVVEPQTNMKEEIRRNHNMNAQRCFLARKPVVDM
jgi:hypothetical protein